MTIESVSSHEQRYLRELEVARRAAEASANTSGEITVRVDTRSTVWDAAATIARTIGRNPHDCEDIAQELMSVHPPLFDRNGLFLNSDEDEVSIEFSVDGQCYQPNNITLLDHEVEGGYDLPLSVGAPHESRIFSTEDGGPICLAPAQAEIETVEERGRNWSEYSTEEQRAAIEEFALRHGISPEEVTWNPFLGPQLQIHGTSLASARYSLEDISPNTSADLLWQVIREQGGLDGIEITDEIRESEQYRNLWNQEFIIMQQQQIARILPTTIPTQSPLGAVAVSGTSLNSNMHDERPSAADILQRVNRQADLVMTYEIARQRLGIE